MQIPHGWFLLTLLFIFTPSFGQSIDIENSHAHLRVTDWFSPTESPWPAAYRKSKGYFAGCILVLIPARFSRATLVLGWLGPNACSIMAKARL